MALTAKQEKAKKVVSVLQESDIETIIGRMSEGVTLKKSCEISGNGYTNIIRRINESDKLKELYACAREAYTHYRVQEMHDIAADPLIEPQRARLMVDCIKWEASKVIPKQYGDKVDHTIGNPDGTPLEICVNFVKSE